MANSGNQKTNLKRRDEVFHSCFLDFHIVNEFEFKMFRPRRRVESGTRELRNRTDREAQWLWLIACREKRRVR
jgi:hypothetical protein